MDVAQRSGVFEAVPVWVPVLVLIALFGFIFWARRTKPRWFRETSGYVEQHPWRYSAGMSFSLAIVWVVNNRLISGDWPSLKEALLLVPIAILQWLALGVVFVYGMRRQRRKEAAKKVGR